MKNIVATIIIALTLLSCSTTRLNVPSAIGVVNLSHYALKDTNNLSPDDLFMAITNENDFNNRFIATATGQDLKTPNFNGQIVLAVSLKPTNKQITVQFDRAEIAGKNLNTYYTVREDDATTTDAQRPTAVATVPKSLSVRQVNFYNNGSLVKSVPVTF
jgi:hypothetical protein